jgi:uncharacterized protein (UPF0332 family)
MKDAASAERLSCEGHANLLRQVFELWAQPEVARRQEAGTLPRPVTINAVQVLLHAAAPPEVRLNDEVRGIARAISAQPVPANELVSYHDVDSLVDFSLEADDDENAGHITAIALPAGWAVLFDTRYNAKHVAEHRASAAEFRTSAADALARGHLRAFAEVAYAAVELLAKAELLNHPDERLLVSKRHGYVSSLYNQHVKLGNADERFASALNNLADLRAAARYLRAPMTLTAERAHEILQVLRDMQEHVDSVSPEWPRPMRADEAQT